MAENPKSTGRRSLAAGTDVKVGGETLRLLSDTEAELVGGLGMGGSASPASAEQAGDIGSSGATSQGGYITSSGAVDPDDDGN